MIKIGDSFYKISELDKAFEQNDKYYVQFMNGGREEITKAKFAELRSKNFAYIGGVVYCNGNSMISVLDNKINMKNGNSLIAGPGDEIFEGGEWWEIGDMRYNPQHITKLWSNKNGKFFSVGNSLPIQMSDSEYAKLVRNINITVSHGTFIGDTQVVDEERTIFYIVPDEDYVMPYLENIVAYGCSINFFRNDGMLVVSDVGRDAHITVECQYWLRPLRVGDDISGGKSIYVKKVDNIEDIIRANLSTGLLTHVNNDVNIPGFQVRNTPFLEFSYRLNGSSQTIYFGATGWNQDIKEDGEYVLPYNLQGIITELYGEGWNGVVLFMKQE